VHGKREGWGEDGRRGGLFRIALGISPGLGFVLIAATAVASGCGCDRWRPPIPEGRDELHVGHGRVSCLNASEMAAAGCNSFRPLPQWRNYCAIAAASVLVLSPARVWEANSPGVIGYSVKRAPPASPLVR
jgi:hypothetical protein